MSAFFFPKLLNFATITHMLWQTFGFENIKKYFERAVAGDSLEHAYLFSGQEMIGKRTLALELGSRLTVQEAQWVQFLVLASKTKTMYPESLLATNPDLLILGNEKVGIDQVRQLKNFLSLKPYAARYKVAIIDNAHEMGAEAANAMLKVLEEPPPHSLIILISANPKALLPTIYSRCLEIKFAPHPRNELLKYLERLDLSKAQAEFLTDFSNGRLGLAYRLKENNTFKNIKKNLEEFSQLLKSNLNDRFKFAEKVLAGEDGTEQVANLLLYWMFYLRSDFSKKLKINRAKVLKSLLITRQILSHPQFNHRLALENLLINI